MATDFRFPDVGEGISEGEIVKWHVREGDTVKEHDVIAEVETDKAVVQIPSPVSGVVLRISHREGETIKVGETLAVIGDKGETAQKAKDAEPASTERKKDAGAVVGELPEAEESPEAPAASLEAAQPKAGKVLASPAARKLAKDTGVYIGGVQGTGEGGLITEDDVRNAQGHNGSNAAENAAPAGANAPTVVRKYDMFGYVERVPLRGVRKVTAKHMVESLYTATHVTHMDEADVTDLFFIREKEKAGMRRRGVHLTFLPFVMKAVIEALREHPYLNASLEEKTQEIVLKKYYNIGFAVDIDGGLLVPVVKEADRKTIAEIAREAQELAEKARDRKLDLMDMRGGTFTITNIGSIGGIFATPIINYPEVAILALGKIADKPVVQGGKIIARKILPLSLAFDHRVLDGAEAARFVTKLIELLQDPERLMMD